MVPRQTSNDLFFPISLSNIESTFFNTSYVLTLSLFPLLPLFCPSQNCKTLQQVQSAPSLVPLFPPLSGHHLQIAPGKETNNQA